jgi:peptidyl-prolyl cis-trans isomerase C
MRAYRWTLGTLASAAALLAVAGRTPAQPPAAAANKPVAVVNGEAISFDELEAAVKMIQRGPSPLELPESKRREARVQALGVLIDDILLRQFLRQNAPRVEPAEVNKKMAELEEALKKDGATLAQYLRETYQTEAQVRTNTMHMIQWQGYLQKHLTEADLKRYYDENRDFFDGVKVQASHIVLRLLPNAPEAERTAARNKLLAIRQEIVSGKLDFAEAAQKYSQCPSAPQGGDVGLFELKLDNVDETFAKAAFALKVGEVSDVVQTDFGLHLIKVTQRTPPKPSDYAKVKEVVMELCDMEMRMAIIAHLRKTAQIEINLR